MGESRFRRHGSVGRARYVLRHDDERRVDDVSARSFAKDGEGAAYGFEAQGKRIRASQRCDAFGVEVEGKVHEIAVARSCAQEGGGALGRIGEARLSQEPPI